ncbi:transmembrane protein 145 isoform X2 [Tetranychus urticae]|uniref:transmembrane protein 145 isoform X2 n=1 Tax=Tetranychus urticae TaxID=32264 RepID=UPI000D6458A4|nr:transmembrane protein 145 isoform X2 [Tetranychus urticae]
MFLKDCISTICFIVFTIPRLTQCKIIEGELVSHENWAFLTRFCFLSKSGRFNYEITYPYDYQVQNLLLYYDSRRQWPSVYKTPTTCEEKEGVLSMENGQVINLTSEYVYSNCHLQEIFDENTNETTKFYRCSHYRVFQSARERWWFIAVSNCQSKKGLKITYRITMTNDDHNPLLKHFSADQFYILHTDVVFTVLYLILLIASIFEAYALYTRHLFHITYKYYLTSLTLQFSSLVFLSTYYIILADRGYSHEVLKLIGKLLESASTSLFLLLLILLAKGYTITRARLKKQTSTKISLFMTLHTTTYIAIFFYEQMFFDPGEVLYMYESWPGYGIIFLRILGWFWFVYSIVFTLMHYPSKSSFLTKLFLLYSVWFISAPVVILISTFVVPKWMREKIINAVELFIAMHAHLVFFIDVMAKNGEAGGETLDRFTHYSYAPSRSNFTVKNNNRPVFSVTSANTTNGDSGIVNGTFPGSTNILLFSTTGTLSGIYTSDLSLVERQDNGYTGLPAVDAGGNP